MAVVGYEWMLLVVGVFVGIWVVLKVLHLRSAMKNANLVSSPSKPEFGFCTSCGRWFSNLQLGKSGSRVCAQCADGFLRDSDLIRVAKTYNGILTKSIVVFELGNTLESAGLILDRFVQHGEARRVIMGSIPVYDFPSARAHLTGLEKQLIELFLERHQLSLIGLSSASGIGFDALDEILTDLERRGVIVKNSTHDEYRLKATL